MFLLYYLLWLLLDGRNFRLDVIKAAAHGIVCQVQRRLQRRRRERVEHHFVHSVLRRTKPPFSNGVNTLEFFYYIISKIPTELFA